MLKCYIEGKTYDARAEIKQLDGGGLFRWNMKTKRWEADIRPDQATTLPLEVTEKCPGCSLAFYEKREEDIPPPF